ncbi:MAG TPA: hypothetical protein VHG71_02545 [Verrucomicrobiae bacterium]|nr:hypothetical protein [Verrucomicrobiae bacterium]
MEKKQWLLIVAVIALAGIYIFFFTDWFRHKNIQIHYANRPQRVRSREGIITVPNLTFGFDKVFRLTEVKVVPLAAFQTNQDVAPLWHLISVSNSVPVERFFYGQGIRGMKPAIAGARAELLESNVVYRLLVAAGSLKGWHDFQLGNSPVESTNQTPAQ